MPLLQGDGKDAAGRPLGDIQRYEPFQMKFEELLDQYNRRYQRAKAALDDLENSWTTLAPALDGLQAKIEALTQMDKQLHEATLKDGLFAVPSLFDRLIPAIQQAHDDAERTGVGDPLAALQDTLVKGARQADEAHRLAVTIQTFRKQRLPGVLSAVRDLASAAAARRLGPRFPAARW